MQNFTKELFTLLDKTVYTEEVFAEAKRLIQAGADVNYREGSYPFETTLARVLDKWNEDQVLSMVKLLVEHGADINQPKDIFYPLWLAASKNHLQVCEFFLNTGVTEGTDEAMQLAIEKNQVEMVQLFLQKGIDANPAYYGVASFLNACSEAYRCRDESKNDFPGLETAKLLLAAGAGPNGEDCEGISPFKNAISHDFLALADLLLEHGAEIEYQDSFPPGIFCGNTPAAIDYLLSKGVSINTTDSRGRSRLIYAIEQSELDLISFLMSKNIDIYLTDNEGYTALHHAAISENLKVLRILLPVYDIEKANRIFPLANLGNEQQIQKILDQSPRM